MYSPYQDDLGECVGDVREKAKDVPIHGVCGAFRSCDCTVLRSNALQKVHTIDRVEHNEEWKYDERLKRSLHWPDTD